MSPDTQPTILAFDPDLFLAVPDVERAADMLADGVAACEQTLALIPPVGRAAHAALGAAQRLSGAPSPAALARLLGAQAEQATALLSVALAERAAPHRVLTGAQTGLIAAGDPMRARPVTLAGDALACEGGAGVTLAPAGVALSARGAPMLIHPDEQAVFLASRLGARIVFLRDAERRGSSTVDPVAARLAASLGVRIDLEAVRWTLCVAQTAPVAA